MNKINVQQTGGFPFETDTLNAMQNAYDIFNALGNIIAPLAIVKGCEVIGNNVANGVVYINGEVLEFRGGQASSTVIIKEETTSRNFENGESKIAYQLRYATFGSSVQTENYKWSDFHRTISIKEIEKRLVHPGLIQDFFGELKNIPLGWHLCDGTNGTPDLRGLFIVGYDSRVTDYNQIGKTGGQKEVTLTTQQIPAHKHSGNTSSNGDHSHSVERIHPYIGTGIGGGFDGGGNAFRSQNVNTSSSGNHSHSFETNEVGGGQSHENRPPFYVLAKIMYKG